MTSATVRIDRLEYQDERLGRILLPKQPMLLTRGIGSGLSQRPGEASRLWAIGDRGPNLKASVAAERYGADVALAPRRAKVMPCLEVGPALVELALSGGSIAVTRVLPISDDSGRPISGLPLAGGRHATQEPVVDLAGQLLGGHPSGADTEGVIALADGGFWVGDEYGPSLIRVGADGRILVRWVPQGCAAQYAGADHRVEERLPALAAKRHLNRGFEAIALSLDERRLHLAFQSPLAHPDKEAHEAACHIRMWTLDAESGALLSQHLYPLDPPEQFRRDRDKGDFARSDIKLSELAVSPSGRLICLERGSETTKLYAVSLDGSAALPPEHLDPDTRPTIEELSATGRLDGLPVLAKTCLLDTDDHLEVGADLEGMALLAPDELLVVSDNDFGVEGAKTGFWRIKFASPL